MKKQVKRRVRSPRAKAVAPATPAVPRIKAVTYYELRNATSRSISKESPSRERYKTIPRPSWGIYTKADTKLPYALLHCVCNTDTFFEFRGDGKAPKPNCCVNAPAYPQEASFRSHLHIRVNVVDASGIRAQVSSYDKALDNEGHRRGGAAPR
jgi:hypothetical protein